jgi:trehalose-6-phosphate synthase
VACSRSDGWNLVALEACALGADTQQLILSTTVGAAEVLAPVARVVEGPAREAALAAALRDALDEGPRKGGRSRREIELPTPENWWRAIENAHGAAAGRRAVHS